MRSRENHLVTTQLQKEAEILKILARKGSPQLLQHQIDSEQRIYNLIEWLEGPSFVRTVANYRANQTQEGRKNLLKLMVSISEAYASVHQQGVIHGDVHSGNLVLLESGEVCLIDFGFSVVPDSSSELLSSSHRGARGYFFEPEYAKAFIEKTTRPQVSFKGEQHILAHLLYELVTGHGYTAFPTDREASMKVLAESCPRTFSEWSVHPWPDLEKVLSKALSRDPEARFESIDEFAQHIKAVRIPERSTSSRSNTTLFVDANQSLADLYLAQLDPEKDLFQAGLSKSPYSSITYGSAGIAYFLYQLSLIRTDALYLSWSKLWVERAIQEIENKGESAFLMQKKHGGNSTMSREVVGYVSPYHTETGIYALQALIAHAMADRQTQFQAVKEFLAFADQPCECIDLTLGKSGVLIGACILFEINSDDQMLEKFGDQLADEIWQEIILLPPIQEEKTICYLGMAHGWAGILYSLMRWWKVRGDRFPLGFYNRLEQLAALGVTSGDGLQWPRIYDVNKIFQAEDFDQSWCNGTSGMLFLWVLAYQCDKNDKWLNIAKYAANNIISSRSHINQLCCGRAGQIYALLELYQETQDQELLSEIQILAKALQQNADNSFLANEYRFSLYKGEIGQALMLEELSCPDQASMPFFARQKW